jgi:hypothetical protein
MINNYWEEKNMSKEILDCLNLKMEKMNLPNWIKEIHCPFCNLKLPLRSIRHIGLCFNTRNFGEMTVEVLCDQCSKMDTLYVRVDISNIEQFIDFLNGKDPKASLVIEEDMYIMKYNNIVSKMIGEEK